MADKVPATANDAIPASVQDAEADTTPTQMLTRQTKQEGGAAAPFGSHTAFFSSEVCERHRIPTHPECAERAQVVRERIVREIPAIQQIQEITPITRQRLLLFHTPKHVDKMVKIFEKFRPQHASSNHGAEVASSSLSSPQRRQGNEKKQEDLHHIDEDTSIGSGTEDAALIAAGAVCDAIDVVMRGGSGDAASGTVSSIKNAFCGVRPPGHHAEPHRAMGFCLFNNVGIGACYLLDAFPEQIKRVTVFDFDVHHGNGTQAKFISDEYPNVQYISTHQAPFYPNTGKPNERGTHGNILNVPLPARTDSRAYRRVFESRVLPAMHAFEPDFILISAGFDAHAQDPLAEIALESEDYHWITQQVVDVAWKHAQGRIVSVLEGGASLSLSAWISSRYQLSRLHLIDLSCSLSLSLFR